MFIRSAVLVALLCACTSSVHGAPRRIVSLLPTATDVILALGGSGLVVARTDFDKNPQLQYVPSFGRTMRPTIEAVLAFRPDLVIAEPDAEGRTLVAQLTRTGVRAYAPEHARLRDLEKIVTDIGALLGAPARADSLLAAMRGQLDAVRRAVARLPAPTVLYVVWTDPATISGAGTFAHEVIEIAGARNAFGDVRQLWPVVALEEVRRRDPAYIVLAVDGADASLVNRVRTLPGWRDLAAVRDGRLIVIEGDALTRPTPRVAETARRLGMALHPGARL